MSRAKDDVSRRLKALFREILSEATVNEDFARRLGDALGGPTSRGRDEADRAVRPHRRPPGILDPFAIYLAGEDSLRRRLSELDVELLKDIIAANGMDSSKLAMKWKTSERLVELIVDTVKSRSRKGDAFRR